MPIYEYRCAACGHRFDVRQGFQDPPEAPCPQCSSRARRVVQVPTVVFKGSGFYSTDQKLSGRGNYWYNRDREQDEKATKDAKGETAPPAPPPSASQVGESPAKD
ncbi:MAG: zinc ribbon domain-containing protein [Chloroflexi bacterium]|nr:zinc ribbon domain-containing protein [Chloroflexota bacterium]